MKWADGRLGIEYEGRQLPFKLCDEYPFVTPGEVVERKRVAEVMTRIEQGQQAVERHRVAAARVALSEKAVVSPKSQRYHRAAPPEHIVEVARPERGSITPIREGYVVRWIRKRPFLYQRVASSTATADGRPAFEDTYVGPLRADVARKWERAGDPSRPPSVAEARAPIAGKARSIVPARAPESAAKGHSGCTVCAPVAGRCLHRSPAGLSQAAAAEHRHPRCAPSRATAPTASRPAARPGEPPRDGTLVHRCVPRRGDTAAARVE